MITRRAFGEELRREREQRGVTLEHISQLTKISVALLAGLERGDCSRWPPGIYSRAYIRDYAQAVGLDRDETATRFCECFSETAFPEGAPGGKPERKVDAPDALPTVSATNGPLRLTFIDEPQERRRDLARRTATIVVDVLLSIAIAAVLSVAFGAGFWMALAVVSIASHVLGIVLGRAHGAEVLAHVSARGHGHDAEAAPTEAALAEAT